MRPIVPMLFLWLQACGAVDVPADTDPEDPPVLHAATYRLTWDVEGAVVDDTGVHIETDLGYVVSIQDGWLTTYTLSLVACDETGLRSHGGEADDSALIGPFYEDLSTPTTTELGAIDFPEASYCQVHVVMASVDEQSLQLSGTLTGPDGSERSLDLGTFYGHARLEDLPALSFEGGEAEVEVRRRWDLDGLDFDVLEEEEAAWEVLSRLSRGIVLDVTPAD